MIRIFNGALDTIEIGGEESLALRGVIDPLDLDKILVPEYQREVLNPSKIESLKKALLTSRVPDIDLGMRGGNVKEVAEAGRQTWLLEDEVFVIDGLQRKTAGQALVGNGQFPHLGVIVHFDTTEVWERKRFEALNIGQTALSNNVTLRNMAHDSYGARVMLDITQNPKFILCNRVTWTQGMRRSDLITSITFYKVVGRLHSHLGPGKGDPRSLARTGINKILVPVGLKAFTANVLAFFNLIEECFGISNVEYKKAATQLKSSFLIALAGVLSDHEDFWEKNTLAVPKELQNKLKKFALYDPAIVALAGSGGMSPRALEQLLIEHLNYNKRTRHLKRRVTADEIVEDELLETEVRVQDERRVQDAVVVS